MITATGVVLVGSGCISWLYSRINYYSLAQILQTTPRLDNVHANNGYYYLEGPVHSENPMVYDTNSLKFETVNLDINTTSGGNNNEYIRLDETIHCILDKSTYINSNTMELTLNGINRTHSLKIQKHVKKSHCSYKIAYPVTINNIIIDEFAESIPLTYIGRVFKPQLDNNELHPSSTRIDRTNVLMGAEYEYSGVPIASKVTIFGWYDGDNKVMKRRKGANIVNVINNDVDDKYEFSPSKPSYTPVIVTKASKDELEEYYTNLYNKWTRIGYAGIIFGSLVIISNKLRK